MLFGAHCPGGIRKAIDAAEDMGADVVQLFVQSPRAWRFPNHDPDTLEKFRERRAESGLAGALVHALYLVNLAAPDETIYSKSVETMRSTVDTAGHGHREVDIDAARVAVRVQIEPLASR